MRGRKLVGRKFQIMYREPHASSRVYVRIQQVPSYIFIIFVNCNNECTGSMKCVSEINNRITQTKTVTIY
jgi:hypothetical protein